MARSWAQMDGPGFARVAPWRPEGRWGFRRPRKVALKLARRRMARESRRRNRRAR